MASAEMPGASNQAVSSTPASKKQNHLVAGRRKLEAYRKKKAEEKKVGDKNTSAEKPIANDVHAEGIFANGSDSGPLIEGNGKETHKASQPHAGVNGVGARTVGGFNEGKSNGLPQNLWSERAYDSEPHKTKSSPRGSVQGFPPFSENIPASAITELEGDLAVKIPEHSDSKLSTSKTGFQNFAGLEGSVHEQMQGTQHVENRSSSNALENDLVSTAPAIHDFISLKHQEPARVVSDGFLTSRIVDNSLQRPSGALFGLRTGSLQDFSLAFPVSKQQTDNPALSLASSIKDERASNGREELPPPLRSSLTSNGMKPRDSKEPQLLFAQTKKLPSSGVGERESLFSSRLFDKASFQPSSGLLPANQTDVAAVPSISDYKEGSSLSVSASESLLRHAFPEQEKDLKPVNQNEGRQKRAENDDFIALEQHIDELTQEKFALQRALDAARSLTESLSQQNSVLTEDFNSQGSIINQLQADLEKKKEEVTTQSLVLSSLMMERERAQQENNSAVERSQILAGEVIGLEEKVLKLRSSELKLQRELETLKSDNDSFRVHLGTLEKDRQNMQSMLEALQEDKKFLQIQLQKTLVSNDGMRTSNRKEAPQVDSRDASTSTDDLGVQTQNTQTAGSVVQRHVSHPQSLDYTGDASSSSILVSSPYSMGVGVPSAFATLSADDFRAINSIDRLITELLSEKGALLESLERESAKASELEALNTELSRKLETQTQRLELVVAQNMAHGANAINTNSIEIEPEYNDYVDEGDEVVERVLGWIVRLFPGGSSRRQSSKIL